MFYPQPHSSLLLDGGSAIRVYRPQGGTAKVGDMGTTHGNGIQYAAGIYSRLAAADFSVDYRQVCELGVAAPIGVDHQISGRTAYTQPYKFSHGDLSFHIGTTNSLETNGFQAGLQRAALLEHLEVLKQVIVSPGYNAEAFPWLVPKLND